jgi:large subunit ribosomal protein L4
MQNYKLSQNKKAHALALKTVLSEKVGNGLIVVDSLCLKEVSTKALANSLKAIKAEGKTLIVTDLPEDEKSIKGIENFILSANNLENVALDELGNVSVYDVLNFTNLVISKDGIKKLEEALK